MISSTGLAARMRRILPLLAAALIVAVAIGSAAAQAAADPASVTTLSVAQETTTSSSAPTGQTGIFPTTTTVASGQEAQPEQGAIIPPPAGQAPLNPGLKIDQMSVRVWPEYDLAAVLVLMNFSLPADVALPATFKFAVPTGAQIAGIGEIDPAGQFTYNYTTSYPPVETGTEWDIVTIEVKQYRDLQIDYYYDPGLPEGGGQRSFPLLVQIPADVGTLLLHVQHPAGAEDFSIQPALDASGQIEDGFTYSVASYPDVKAGSTLGHTVSYYSPDGALSVDSSGQGEPSTTQVNTNTVLLAAILIVVVIIGALVVYRVFFSNSGRGNQRGDRRGARRSQERSARGGGTKQQQKNGKASKGSSGKSPATAASATKAAAPQTAKAGSAAGRQATTPRPSPEEAATAVDDGAVAESAAEEGDEGAEYCVACGEELPTESPFCPSCGEARR